MILPSSCISHSSSPSFVCCCVPLRLGNHKLTAYGFPIHAGIDGFSRYIFFIRCNVDNRASTVHHCFMDGVDRYGVPGRIRTDQGGENIDVISFMIRIHSGLLNGHQRPAIVGTSVRNQRIEAFFNHINAAVTDVYKRLFDEWAFRYPHWFPNGMGVRFCLQYLFLDRINQDIERFTLMWNNHRMGQLGNKTPFQVFHDPNAHRVIIPYNANDDYGVDFDVDAGYDMEQDEIEALRRPIDQVICCILVSFTSCSSYEPSSSYIVLTRWSWSLWRVHLRSHSLPPLWPMQYQ